jgi:hypothetical protein
MLDYYRNFLVHDSEDEEDSDTSTQKAKKKNHKKHAKTINQPRLISVKMFVDMFEAVSKNSSLSKRCDGHDEQDRILHKEIAALNKRCNELKVNIDNVEKSAESNLKLSQAK